MDRELAQMLGRIGAYRLHATHNAYETTAAARRGFLAKFEREVDPEGVLDPADRAARARAARRAYLLRLSLKSAMVRRQRAAESRAGGQRTGTAEGSRWR